MKFFFFSICMTFLSFRSFCCHCFVKYTYSITSGCVVYELRYCMKMFNSIFCIDFYLVFYRAKNDFFQKKTFLVLQCQWLQRERNCFRFMLLYSFFRQIFYGCLIDAAHSAYTFDAHIHMRIKSVQYQMSDSWMKKDDEEEEEERIAECSKKREGNTIMIYKLSRYYGLNEDKCVSINISIVYLFVHWAKQNKTKHTTEKEKRIAKICEWLSCCYALAICIGQYGMSYTIFW